MLGEEKQSFKHEIRCVTGEGQINVIILWCETSYSLPIPQRRTFKSASLLQSRDHAAFQPGILTCPWSPPTTTSPFLWAPWRPLWAAPHNMEEKYVPSLWVHLGTWGYKSSLENECLSLTSLWGGWLNSCRAGGSPHWVPYSMYTNHGIWDESINWNPRDTDRDTGQAQALKTNGEARLWTAPYLYSNHCSSVRPCSWLTSNQFVSCCCKLCSFMSFEALAEGRV